MVELFPEGFEEVELDGATSSWPPTRTRAARSASGRCSARTCDARSSPAGRSAWKQFHRPSGSVGSGSARRGRSPTRTRSRSSSTRAGRSARAPTRRRGSASSCCSSRAAASLLDLGCGSGVLAIAAAKLGFAPVTALDIDEAPSRRRRENARRERGRGRGRAARTCSPTSFPGGARASRTSSSTPRASVARRVASRGTLVTSGYPGLERPDAAGLGHVRTASSAAGPPTCFERD